jgi:hypothetical protein
MRFTQQECMALAIVFFTNGALGSIAGAAPIPNEKREAAINAGLHLPEGFQGIHNLGPFGGGHGPVVIQRPENLHPIKEAREAGIASLLKPAEHIGEDVLKHHHKGHKEHKKPKGHNDLPSLPDVPSSEPSATTSAAPQRRDPGFASFLKPAEHIGEDLFKHLHKGHHDIPSAPQQTNTQQRRDAGLGSLLKPAEHLGEDLLKHHHHHKVPDVSAPQQTNTQQRRDPGLGSLLKPAEHLGEDLLKHHHHHKVPDVSAPQQTNTQQRREAKHGWISTAEHIGKDVDRLANVADKGANAVNTGANVVQAGQNLHQTIKGNGQQQVQRRETETITQTGGFSEHVTPGHAATNGTAEHKTEEHKKGEEHKKPETKEEKEKHEKLEKEHKLKGEHKGEHKGNTSVHEKTHELGPHVHLPGHIGVIAKPGGHANLSAFHGLNGLKIPNPKIG